MILIPKTLSQKNSQGQDAPPLKRLGGFTLTELLVTFVITAVMMTAFTAPFMAERIFWREGNQQMEAQRDAQLVLRAVARFAREANAATVTTPASGQTQITLTCPLDTTPVTWAPVVFLGGPGLNGGQMQMTDQRVSPARTIPLINGIKSKVQVFTASFVNKILFVQVQVQNQDFGSETLETRIFLRNAA
jgi:type II secretory pathway pseudopilin PulG